MIQKHPLGHLRPTIQDVIREKKKIMFNNYTKSIYTMMYTYYTGGTNKCRNQSLEG